MGYDLLDDFNRADNTDPGPNWLQDISDGGYASHDIVSNQFKAAVGQFCSDAWYQPFSADQQVGMDLITIPVGGSMRIMGRIQNRESATYEGYELEIADNESYIVITRNTPVNATRTTLAVLGVIFAAGNKAKLRCEGTSITAWRDTGAGFVQIGGVTDSGITNGGYIGLWSQNQNTSVIDNFRGGNIFDGQDALIAHHGIGMGRW